MVAMQALIFDCDGVLVDTERDGHRVAFNATFRQLGWPTVWSVERYGVYLFNDMQTGWSRVVVDRTRR